MDLKLKRNIKPFDGEKYSIWKFRIRALLSEMNVLKVIESDPIIRDSSWDKSNRIAKSIIVEYLSDSYLGFANEDSTAKDILKSLDALYERKSIATQLALRKKLLGMKLQGDVTLIRHFAAFDDLITELLAAGAKLEETDKVAHLLLTLPSSYDGVITAIETLSEDNLTLAFVKTRLLDHEVKLKNESNDTSAKVLQAAAEGKKRQFRKRNFENHTFSNNQKDQNTRKKFNIAKCYHCGRKGHVKNDCYYFKRLNQPKSTDRLRTVQAVDINQPSASAQSSADFSGFAFMTGEYNVDAAERKITFLLDSGASDHIINREDLFINSVDLSIPIKISIAKQGHFISANKRGTLHVISNMGVRGTLEDVLFCPEAPYNLLSVSRLQQAGTTVIFDHRGTQICKDGKIIMRGRSINNLIALDFEVSVHLSCSMPKVYNVMINNYELWHKRLGHMSKSKFLELKNNKMTSDINLIDKVIPGDSLCESCIYGKQSRLPFNQNKDKSYIQRPLYVVHTDVCGPITPSTINNKNYFVLFVDQYTHYCVVYLLTHKSDVFSAFKDFVSKSEARFNLKIVYLYCDNGREYLSNDMKDYCVEKGITYHFTVPRTPQLNGVSERMVRSITEKARSILNGANLPKLFWGEAVLTAVYLINLTPTNAIKSSKTPFEMWHNRKPQIKYLKVFGSTVYVHDKIFKTKFDVKSWKGILMGYEPNGYKVWNPECEKFITVRDVIVDETNFLQSRPILQPEENVVNSRVDINIDKNCKSMKSQNTDRGESDSSKSDDYESPHKIRKSNHDTIESEQINTRSVIGDDNTNSNVELRRSDRLKGRPSVPSKKFDDYLMCTQTILYDVPNSFLEIKTRHDRAQWESAIDDELNSLLLNKTWSLVPRPNGKNIVDCKWIFSIKNDEFGKPLRYKARLVARGFSQQYLIDYNETFAPVARIASFRFLIAFANQYKLLIHHMDVKTAFLNGELKEEIYMKVPEGISCKKDYVCKLNKALYGLKQAARCWFEIFEQSLKEKGFQNSSVDRCIYILNKGDIQSNIYVILYVDDLVIISANKITIDDFKMYLMSKFKMTDLQEIKLFLGIKVTRSNDMLMLDQSAYIKTILAKFGMQDCKPVKTPLESKLDYEALNSDDNYNAPCRNVIGCLMYIMLCTRPDLSTSVNILSRYTNKNNKELWKCLKRVLRYLKGTSDLKLIYKRCEYNQILTGYVDSDWGGNDTNDRKSTTGYIFKLFEKCTITWNTKKQQSVAASSTEAEYMALYEAVKEALWLKSLANSIHIIIPTPIIIYEDNNGCISIANNPTNHKRTKHIDIKYHFSREQIEKNVIKLNYIPTGQQLADALTKPLPAVTFHEMTQNMGLQ